MIHEDTQPNAPVHGENGADGPSGGPEAAPEDTNPTRQARTQYGLPDEWTDEQVSQWMKRAQNKEVAVKNSDGVWLYDPTRNGRAIGSWTTDELRAFLKGELQAIPPGKTDALIREYARRETVDPAWSNRELLEYFRTGVEPPKTASGLWLNDVTRARRKVGDWTDQELRAWAEGEIQPAGSVTATLLAKELHQRFKLGGYNDSVDAVLKRYNFLKEQAAAADTAPAVAPAPIASKPTPVAVGALTAMNVSFIDETLNRYAGAVKPGTLISDETGAAAQRALDNLFHYILRLEGPALVEGLNRLKAFINKHRSDVFDPSNAYRFVHGLKGDAANQRKHVDFIELFLIVTGTSQARRKQIDVRRMLSIAPPAKVDLLVDYFTNHA